MSRHAIRSLLLAGQLGLAGWSMAAEPAEPPLTRLAHLLDQREAIYAAIEADLHEHRTQVTATRRDWLALLGTDQDLARARAAELAAAATLQEHLRTLAATSGTAAPEAASKPERLSATTLATLRFERAELDLLLEHPGSPLVLATNSDPAVQAAMEAYESRPRDQGLQALSQEIAQAESAVIAARRAVDARCVEAMALLRDAREAWKDVHSRHPATQAKAALTEAVREAIRGSPEGAIWLGIDSDSQNRPVSADDPEQAYQRARLELYLRHPASLLHRAILDDPAVQTTRRALAQTYADDAEQTSTASAAHAVARAERLLRAARLAAPAHADLLEAEQRLASLQQRAANLRQLDSERSRLLLAALQASRMRALRRTSEGEQTWQRRAAINADLLRQQDLKTERTEIPVPPSETPPADDATAAELRRQWQQAQADLAACHQRPPLAEAHADLLQAEASLRQARSTARQAHAALQLIEASIDDLRKQLTRPASQAQQSIQAEPASSD